MLATGWITAPMYTSEEIYIKNPKKFWNPPPVRGVWKLVKTHYRPKIENHPIVVFDSSNEAPEHTDCNAKNLNSFWCTVAEKIKKNSQKW